MLNQGEKWLEEHDCLDEEEGNWDDEEWTNWDDEEDWEHNDMPEFNSTEDLYWAFLQHVESNCSDHY
jgi:hypothetical protein